MRKNIREFNAAKENANAKIAELAEKQELEQKILLFGDFYGQVATCAKSGLCDRKIACSIFGGKAVAFGHNFYGVFEKWKSDWGESFIDGTYAYFSSPRCKT